MRDEHNRISGAGASVAAIVMGAPPRAEEFCRQRGLPFACLADPARVAYRAFGVPGAGPASWLLHPKMARPFARVVRRGVGVGLPLPGQDVRQLPATFVVGRGGGIRLARYARHAADNPPVGDVLSALGVG